MNLILRLFLKLLDGVNILFKYKKYKIKQNIIMWRWWGKLCLIIFVEEDFLTCLFTE